MRLAQVARMLAIPELHTTNAARDAIAADPGRFASALVAEAADSDDVISTESALAYLEARLAELADLLDAGTREAIETAFRERIAGWG